MFGGRRAALVAAALAVVAFTAVWAYILSPAFGGANKCEMTYMRPAYIPVPLPSTLANDRAYGLYLYREGLARVTSTDAQREIGRLGKPMADGSTAAPAIFVPGNGGSYKQVRSVGAESFRISGKRREERERTRLVEREKRRRARGESADDETIDDETNCDSPNSKTKTPILDWYALDFNEELSAFHGALLRDQIEFTELVIQHVLSLYANTKDLIVLGHSMGGVVARGALTSPGSFSSKNDDSRNSRKAVPTRTTLVTLAAPHFFSPAFTQVSASKALRAMNKAWRDDSWNGRHSSRIVAFASITGGDRDRQVLAAHADVSQLVNPRFGFSGDVGSIPGAAGVSADHQCVLWCNQVVKAVANALLDVVDFHEDAGKEKNASHENVSEWMESRRAVLEARLFSPTKKTDITRTTEPINTVARFVLLWTPSAVPATVALAFAAAANARRRRILEETNSRITKPEPATPGSFRSGGFGIFALLFWSTTTASACVFQPAAGVALGAIARVARVCSTRESERDASARGGERSDDVAFWKSAAHVGVAVAGFPSVLAAGHCLYHSGGARTARYVGLFLGGEDAWWASLAACPAWLDWMRLLESDSNRVEVSRARVIETVFFAIASSIAITAIRPGNAHRVAVAAAVDGVGAFVVGGLRAYRYARVGRNRAKTKTR